MVVTFNEKHFLGALFSLYYLSFVEKYILHTVNCSEVMYEVKTDFSFKDDKKKFIDVISKQIFSRKKINANN